MAEVWIVSRRIDPTPARPIAAHTTEAAAQHHIERLVRADDNLLRMAQRNGTSHTIRYYSLRNVPLYDTPEGTPE